MPNWAFQVACAKTGKGSMDLRVRGSVEPFCRIAQEWQAGAAGVDIHARSGFE